MRLWALSDVHVRYPKNRAALEALAAHPEDTLVLAGDLGESEADLLWVLDTLGPRFRQLVWVPGNHELWTLTSEGPTGLRGQARYERLVGLCQQRGVLTPEDDYPLWKGERASGSAESPLYLCPLFLLYDYSFRPDDVPEADVLGWAREDGIVGTDERLLHPDPYASRAEWCAARCEATAARLSALPANARTVLINHYPLRYDLVFIPRVPRYSPWCGTRRTEDWHRRFRAEVVVSGHLHVRTTQWRDGVRFEEVSLGYPKQWQGESGANRYLREILPGPKGPVPAAGRRFHY